MLEIQFTAIRIISIATLALVSVETAMTDDLTEDGGIPKGEYNAPNGIPDRASGSPMVGTVPTLPGGLSNIKEPLNNHRCSHNALSI